MTDSFGDEVNQFFEQLPKILEDAGEDHLARARAWRRALSEAGLAGFGIPTEYGGRLTPTDGSRQLQKLAQGRVPPEESTFGIGLHMAVPTLLQYGSEVLKNCFTPTSVRV